MWLYLRSSKSSRSLSTEHQARCETNKSPNVRNCSSRFLQRRFNTSPRKFSKRMEQHVNNHKIGTRAARYFVVMLSQESFAVPPVAQHGNRVNGPLVHLD